MKACTQTRWGRAVPIRHNKTIEAEHYAARVEETRRKHAEFVAKQARPRTNAATPERCEIIARLLIEGKTYAQVNRETGASHFLIDKVQGDVWIGKYDRLKA